MYSIPELAGAYLLSHSLSVPPLGTAGAAPSSTSRRYTPPAAALPPGRPVDK